MTIPPSYGHPSSSISQCLDESGTSPSLRLKQTSKKLKYNFKRNKATIRTCLRRRTEIEELTCEMKRLKKFVELYAHKAKVLKERDELKERVLTNKMMRSVLYTQRLSVAGTLSKLTQFHCESAIRFFDLPIRLSANAFERKDALLKMRHDRLQVAKQFIESQYQGQSTTPFCDRKKFETSSGDLVSTRFEVCLLPEADNIKVIFDGLRAFVHNIEINLSDVVGDITIRKNDDADPGSAVAQHRLVTAIDDTVQTDINSVMFADYRPSGSDQPEIGLMICDTVDEDELFPYRPAARIRQDLAMITLVQSHQGEEGKPVIALTQWWCLRIRKSDISMPPHIVERIRTGVDKMSAAMLSTARFAGHCR